MERWFQNTRGLVIVILAIATCALLLATDPDDGVPAGVSSSSSNGGSQTATPPSTTQPVVTTTTFARPTLEEGTADTTNTMVVQERLNVHGYDVGTPDGDFGPGTKTQVIAFQTAKGISPANGVVAQATWTALLAEPSTTTTPPTTEP